MDVPQLLHVLRREREAFAIGMPLAGAPLHEEECFVVDAGNFLHLVWSSLFAFRRRRVHRPSLGWTTREIYDQSWDLLRGPTPSQIGALPAVVSSGFSTAKSAQCTFRSADFVADKDLLPVEHVLSDFSEAESPGESAGATNVVGSRLANCQRPEVTPCVARRVADLL